MRLQIDFEAGDRAEGTTVQRLSGRDDIQARMLKMRNTRTTGATMIEEAYGETGYSRLLHPWE